jgi:quinol monooxygenase YgiN
MTAASNKSAEYHIICELHAQPKHRQKVKDLLLELVGPAREEKGNLFYHVYQDRDALDTFHIVDGWSTKDAYLSHHNSPNVARVVKEMSPFLDGEFTEHATVQITGD